MSDAVDELCEAGFPPHWARYALDMNGGRVSDAVAFLFDHTEKMDELVRSATSGVNPVAVSKTAVPATQSWVGPEAPSGALSASSSPVSGPSVVAGLPAVPVSTPSFNSSSNSQVTHQTGDANEISGESAEVSVSSEGAGLTWKCKACTFQNIKDSDVCEICATSRITSGGEVFDPGESDGLLESDGGWMCGACTFQNKAQCAVACAVCGASKGATFSSAQLEQGMSESAALVAEAEVLSRDRGISLEEARRVIQDREREDRKLAEELAEPTVSCMICMDDLKVSECFTVDCESNHRFCFECMRRHVKVSLGEKKLATCLGCSHVLTQIEVRQLFGEGSKELAAHLDAEIINVMASNKADFIACPTPDCKAYLGATTPGAQERCECSACGAVFCSLCKEA
eukprot:CAMPEP_0172603694 /NCGR_PEP_ID=MMETSP1068-20121228/23953_1 /TAXON_ID=35684 /ORGANISM="Pseudopedinella elastica, Strain CCMP716" /LENGTH=399 /DNA_ID=CAMNT_0013405529 /DNA_START=247 /DNA_END=1442 /DNA_ORIENTATION=-